MLPLRRIAVTMVALTTLVIFNLASPSRQVVSANSSSSPFHLNCLLNRTTCTEVSDSETVFGQGVYVGHDEPSTLFYSNQSGAGNSNLYTVTLPTDPPTLPTQNGTGGTFNFQLHPAFWFGMAMCDTQSYPEFTTTCSPDSDTNIFDNSDPTAPDFMGHHPGAAFMEMQFYPPGWVAWAPGTSCDSTRWCAALNIDSLGLDAYTGKANNRACLNTVGEETVNFAFITHDGLPQAPADPVDQTLATVTPDPSKDLFMNSGDQLTVDMHDTSAGFRVIVNDLTTHQSGSMTASIANHFGQVLYDPNATTCTNIPYAFHPMYASSSEHTRVPWAAHSYNVSFSDEIGHFEYCNGVAIPHPFFGGTCAAAGVNDPNAVDGDDNLCFNPSDSTLIQVGGCLDSDVDFDGVPYQSTWPGTLTNHGQDAQVHPSSILFTSPRFNGSQNFDRVAFETDLPRIESATNPPCQNLTGAGCVNPPPEAHFYPLFSTRMANQSCAWQLGGANIPGTNNTFGGTSAAEFGPLLLLTYPSKHDTTVSSYNDFRQVLSSNPCPS